MMTYWPIILIVCSNIFYNICAKSTPEKVNPLAALIVTYLIGALTSAIVYFLTTKNSNLLTEYKHINWSTFILGLAIVGIEAGSIYMYQVGWNLNTGQIVHSSISAIAFLFFGFLLYKEPITWNKIVGMIVCLIGLYIINKK